MDKTPSFRLTGVALLIPAALAWLLALVLPTVQLLSLSFQKYSPLRGTEPELVGLANYEAALEEGVIGAVLFGVSLAVLPLIVFFLTGPLLGWAAGHTTSRTRRLARVAMTLPVAAFVPLAAGYAWMMRDFPDMGLTPGQLSIYQRVALLAGGFGLICALSVTVYSAVFRPTGRPRWLAALAVSALAVLAAAAIGIQQFGTELIMAYRAGDPGAVEILMYDNAFRSLRFGHGAANAGVEFFVLAVLGLLAAGVVILTGMRISVLPRNTPEHPTNTGATVGLWVGVLLIAGLAAWFLLPWLGGLGNPVEQPLRDLAGWIAPLPTTLIAVGLGIAGGFGIGALRPLGRYSELLLLPFAPWLFVGTGPLSLPAFRTALEGKVLGTFWSTMPPLWTLVPALFIFTLLFRGQAQSAANGTFWREVIVPVLPAAALTTVTLWLVQAQDSLWALLAYPKSPTAIGAFVQSVVGARYRADLDQVAYAAATPLWLIPIVVVGAVTAQWFYTDRLVITTRD